jgi:heme-degrading monooxygenase HmoA
MYAVVGTAKIDANRSDEAAQLAKNIMANMSEAPGFVSGVIARSLDHSAGRSMMIFETEEAAQAIAANARNMVPADGPTEVIALEVFEVVEHR